MNGPVDLTRKIPLGGPGIVAIAGPKNDGEMRQALGALKAGPLDDEEVARVRAIGDHVYRQRSIADWFR